MHKILVAVDGSEHSIKVVDCAATIAGALHASVIVVSVVPESLVPADYLDDPREQLSHDSYFERISKAVVDRVRAHIREAGLECEAVTGVGNPANFILATAKNEGATMIVLGVFGLHHLPRIRSLGSVSRRVVENSAIPVTLVP
jgi:nucleotide-binding universal stress UspA family protein